MPTLPIRTQLFDAFLGLQEGIHSIILPDLYSSGGSKNLYIDKYGRARAILGYDNLHSTAITTHTGGSAVGIVGLFGYRSLSGGSDTRRLLAVIDDGTNEWEVHHSTDSGVNWSFLTDYGSSVVGKFPDFAQLGDDAFLTNGVSAVQAYNGSALSAAGGTQSPTVSGASGSAGALSGNFQWKLVSVETGTRHAGSVPSTAIALTDEQGNLTWTQDSDTDVTGYELYRTTGTGLVYYFVDYIDGRTTTSYTDTAPDILILENRLLEEHGDAPPSGAYFVEPHQQRMWYGRTDTDPRKAWYSDIGDPDSVYDENNIDFTDADSIGDVVVGLLGAYESSLVVFLERSIWLASGTGQIIGDVADWSRTRTNARVGAVSSRAFQRVPAGAIYTDQKGNFQTTTIATLAYFTSFGDIRLFDGDNDLIISYPVVDTLGDLNFSKRGTIISFNDPVRNEIGWVFPTGSTTTPDTAVVWNHAFGVWYVRSPQPFSSVLATDFVSSGEVLLAGEALAATGGYVYQLWSGATFNGTPIKVQWMTKTLYGVDENGRPDLSTRKRWRWIDLLTQEASGVSFTVEWMQGNVPNNAAAFGSTTVSPAGSTVVSSENATIQSSDGSDLQVTVSSDIIRILLRSSSSDYLHHEGMRLRISSEANQGQWALEGLMLTWQVLPGLNRRVNP